MKAERTIRTRLIIGDELYDEVSKANVLIAGVGGVGSYAAEALVRFGIKSITLIDYDKVDESNINRQIIALGSTLGLFKTEVIRERILDINPQADVTIKTILLDENNIEKIIDKKYDYVIDAIDMLKSKIALLKECIRKDIVVISSMGAGNKLHPELLKISTLDKTGVCPLARKLRQNLCKEEQKKVKVIYSEERAIKQKAIKENIEKKTGSVSFVPAAAGLLAASALINDRIEMIKNV